MELYINYMAQYNNTMEWGVTIFNHFKVEQRECECVCVCVCVCVFNMCKK